jgi:microcystin-dependent protein
MAEPFIGEIRMFSFGFVPRYWALCAGQTLPINQNQALFSLIGTTYGGNGVSTFMLPNLQGRAPMNQNSQNSLGVQVGTETVTLSAAQLPSHIHIPQASTTASALNTPAATNALGAPLSGKPIYAQPSNLTPMNSGALGATPGQPHENMQPSLVLNFCIALSGLFPSRS